MLGIRSIAKRGWNHGVFSLRRNPLPIELDTAGRLGLFAVLTWCVLLARSCSSRGISPFFVLSRKSPYSSPDYDCLRDTFHQKQQLPYRSLCSLRLRDLSDFPIPLDFQNFTFEQAHFLFFKHFSIPATISTQAASVIAHNTDGQYLAIHYRGTDKVSEGTQVQPMAFLDLFRQEVEARYPKVRTVFIATDVPDFLATAHEKLRGFRVFSNNDQVKADGHSPIHFSSLARNVPRALAEDALINVLVLARAQLLVKTPSILSGWAKVFNPKLDALLIGDLSPHAAWFPDSLLQKFRSPRSPDIVSSS
jgi:hypothetical protein